MTETSTSLHTLTAATTKQREITLAVVWAVTHFRHFLYGKPFTLVTDHQPLEWLLTSNKLTGKHARWALILQEYDFKIVHGLGLKHANADVCSHHSLPTTVDNGARRN